MNRENLVNLFYIVISVLAGAIVNFLGDTLVGVRLELFYGVATFSPWWIIDLFLVPCLAGMVVSMIYGLGGKIWCYFAPLVVRVYSYIELKYLTGVPDGATLLEIHFWVLLVIVAVESAAIGGVFGEILVKKTYGRRPKHLVYKQKTPPRKGHA